MSVTRALMPAAIGGVVGSAIAEIFTGEINPHGQLWIAAWVGGIAAALLSSYRNNRPSRDTSAGKTSR